jgi:hypothetical protein
MLLSRSYRCLLSVLLCIFKNLDRNIMKRESVDDAAALSVWATYSICGCFHSRCITPRATGFQRQRIHLETIWSLIPFSAITKFFLSFNWAGGERKTFWICAMYSGLHHHHVILDYKNNGQQSQQSEFAKNCLSEFVLRR